MMVFNDRVLGAAALVVAVVLAWYGHDLIAPFAYEPVGPRVFPMLVAVTIALCGVRLMVKRGTATAANPPGASARIALMVAVMAGYSVAFQWLGFVIATTIMAAHGSRG
jgi:putative tricarboxylic transport membrane protein